MVLKDSTLEDIRMWFEEGMLIAKFIEGEGHADEAKSWRTMLTEFLNAYELDLCHGCGACYERLHWDEFHVDCYACTLARLKNDPEYYEDTHMPEEKN